MMLYDVRVALRYDYEAPVQGGRHLVRLMPMSIPGAQRVIAAALSFDPQPDEQNSFTDFFFSTTTSIAFKAPHGHLDVRLAARVSVEQPSASVDLSPTLSVLGDELPGCWTLDHNSPHHFVSASPRIGLDPAISEYARVSIERTPSVQAATLDLCRRIHRDFTYDTKATEVSTSPSEAFALKRGVCQDFAQVMIAGLRGLGIPAAYVSGLLRTIPPKGQKRLEGADAMHAWVRVWCGRDVGWVALDPTNAMAAGADHITIGYGRDYSDVSPIVGVLKTIGSHKAEHSVDVVLID